MGKKYLVREKQYLLESFSPISELVDQRKVIFMETRIYCWGKALLHENFLKLSLAVINGDNRLSDDSNLSLFPCNKRKYGERQAQREFEFVVPYCWRFWVEWEESFSLSLESCFLQDRPSWTFPFEHVLARSPLPPPWPLASIRESFLTWASQNIKQESFNKAFYARKNFKVIVIKSCPIPFIDRHQPSLK